MSKTTASPYGRWLCVAVCCVACGLVGFLLGQRRPSSANHDDQSQPTAVSWIEWAFGVARQEDKLADPEQSHALMELAFIQARPGDAESLWQRCREYVVGQALPHREKIVLLGIFGNRLDEIVLRCRTQEQFQEMWQIRTEVDRCIGQMITDLDREADGQIKGVLAKLSDELAGSEQADSTKPANVVEWVRKFTRLEDELSEELHLLAASPPALITDADHLPNHKSIDSMIHGAEGLLEAAEMARQQLQDKLDGLSRRVAEGEVIEASDERAKAKGPCEVLLNELSELFDVLESANLDRWLTLKEQTTGQKAINTQNPSDSKSTATWQEQVEKCIRLQQDAITLQQQRYNLWALQQIRAADAVESWDGCLGQLRLELLHPVVSSLYSGTVEKRMEKSKNPDVRRRRVRKLLTTTKKRLSAF